MGRPRKYNGLSEEKRNIISQPVEMYNIKTAGDIAVVNQNWTRNKEITTNRERKETQASHP